MPVVQTSVTYRSGSGIRINIAKPSGDNFAPSNGSRSLVVAKAPTRPFGFAILRKRETLSRFGLLLGILSVALAGFGFGVYATWLTPQIEASRRDQNAAIVNTDSQETAPGRILLDDNLVIKTKSALSVPQLTHMTLSQVETYLEDGYKTPQMREEERLALREKKLVQYLEKKKSPLANIADTLARLKHWRLVLAISNSESSLGKRCADNNCSGIGVEPGHRLWREYATKADWAKDLDRLIERRYKDWTLDEMNGVYNQPGSQNWILAASQVLHDLQSIE